MIYYDRRLPPDLLALLLPGGPLAWLVEYVRSHDNSRIEFRANKNKPGTACLQIYCGRGSAAQVFRRADGNVTLKAHKEYRAISPELFDRPYDPAGLQPLLQRHLIASSGSMKPGYAGGEGAIQNALMHRYSLIYKQSDRFLAVDSEVRVGFDSDATYAKGSLHRSALTKEIQTKLGDPAMSSRNKLDTLGILPTGELAVIEIKDRKGDIRKAAQQLATHLYTLHTLRAQDPDGFKTAVHGLVDQKIACRLLPSHPPVPRLSKPETVAVIAAPDPRPNWKSEWEKRVGNVLKNVPGVHYGVRFWLLSPQGEVLDEHRL